MSPSGQPAPTVDDLPTVLIIDDEESMRDACAQVLSREGFAVVTAANGEQGLIQTADQNPDIVFVDLKMPKMAGMAVLDELMHSAPDTVKVVITAYATVTTALEALRHGAYDFLAKPFTPDELRAVANRALEHRRLTLRTRRLEAERDQAKRKFLELVSSEVRAPVGAAVANLRQLSAALEGQSGERKLAVEALERLERLLRLVDRWQNSGPNGD